MSTIQPLMDWLAAHPTLSSLVIVAIAATESLALIGILVPGVALMLGLGTLVGLGVLSLWPTMFWAFVGAVIGDGVSYWLGHYYEHQLREIWPLSRYPRLVVRGERFFKKHGSISVFFGRFIGPIRPVIPAVAGIMKMPPLKFYTINILSALLWAPVVILPGVAVGASFHVAGTVAFRFVVLSVALLMLIWFLVWSSGRLLKLVLAQFKVTGKTAAYTLTGIGVTFILIASAAYLSRPGIETDNYQLRNMQAWWHQDWKNVAETHAKLSVAKDINIQWWSSLKAMDAALQNQHWRIAKNLSLKNVAQWLMPELKTNNVPIWPVSVSGLGAERVYMYDFSTENRSLILRLWPSRTVANENDELLWLGSLSSLELKELAPTIAMVKLKAGLKTAEDRSLLYGLKGVAIKHPNDNNKWPVYLIRFLQDDDSL